MTDQSSKKQKRATTNYTNNTNKDKNTMSFIKEFIVNSFVRFVLFVVKKWDVGYNNKISVVCFLKKFD